MMERTFITVLLLAINVYVIAEAANRNATVTPSAILHRILMNYDSAAAPGEVLAESKATKVGVGLFVKWLSIDERTETASSVVYFRQKWHDERLRLGRSTGNKKLFSIHVIDSNQIWLPDTYIASQVTPSTLDNRSLKVSSDGSVWYVQRMYVTVPVKLNYIQNSKKRFIIPFTIASFGRNTDSLVIEAMPAGPLVVDESITIPRHMLVENTQTDCTQENTAGTYSCLNIGMHVERHDCQTDRRTQLAIISVCFSVVIIVSYMAFWLSPSTISGVVSRILIGLVTIAMSFSIGYLDKIDVGRNDSLFTPRDVLIGGGLFVVVAAFIESVVVIALASSESPETKGKDDSKKAQRNCNYWNDKQRKIDLTAKIVTPTVFVIICIVFVVSVHL